MSFLVSLTRSMQALRLAKVFDQKKSENYLQEERFIDRENEKNTVTNKVETEVSRQRLSER